MIAPCVSELNATVQIECSKPKCEDRVAYKNQPKDPIEITVKSHLATRLANAQIAITGIATMENCALRTETSAIR